MTPCKQGSTRNAPVKSWCAVKLLGVTRVDRLALTAAFSPSIDEVIGQIRPMAKLLIDAKTGCNCQRVDVGP